MACYSCWALALALVACTLPASVFSQLPAGISLPPLPGLPANLTQTDYCTANQVLVGEDLKTCQNFGAALKTLGIHSMTVKVYVYEVFTATQPSASEEEIVLGAAETNTKVTGLAPGTGMPKKQFVVMVYSMTDPSRPIAVVGNSRLGVALTHLYASAPGFLLSYAPGSMGTTSVDLRLPYQGATLKQRQYQAACYRPNPTGCNYAQMTDAPFQLTPGDVHEFLPYVQIGPLTLYGTAPIRVPILDAAQANALPSCNGPTCICTAVGYIPVRVGTSNNFTCKALGEALIDTSMVQSGDSVEVDVYHLDPTLEVMPVWNATYTWTVTNTLRPTELLLGEFYVFVSRQFMVIAHPLVAFLPAQVIGIIQQAHQNSSSILNQTAGSDGMVTVSPVNQAAVGLFVYRRYSASCRTSLQGSCAYMELGESKALAPGMYEFAPYIAPNQPDDGPTFVYPPQRVTVGESSSGAGAHLPSTIAMVMALFSMVALVA